MKNLECQSMTLKKITNSIQRFKREAQKPGGKSYVEKK